MGIDFGYDRWSIYDFSTYFSSYYSCSPRSKWNLVVSYIPMDAGNIDYLFLPYCMEKLVAAKD